MPQTTAQALQRNFLGNSPGWYKQTIIAFLILNPMLVMYDPFVAGWVLVIEFIFTLAMALKCYPLQPGGLLAIQAGQNPRVIEQMLRNYLPEKKRVMAS